MTEGRRVTDPVSGTDVDDDEELEEEAEHLVYHRIAGTNLDRLSALSDGVFAIALTLLVLDLHVPVNAVIHHQAPLWEPGQLLAEQPLWHELGGLGPRFLAYLLGFLALGMFWVGQQTQFNHFTRSNRHLTWIHLTFLLGVSVMPFTTSLLAEFIEYRTSLVLYWLNLLFLGMVLLGSLVYAQKADLLRPGGMEPMRSAWRRIVVVQLLYAGAVALCVVNTYLSLGVIVLLQLNSAIAPPFRPFNRF